MRFHVNPDTGDVSKCRAEISCPFGGEETHFASEKGAERHAEQVSQEIAEREKRNNQIRRAYSLYGTDIIPFSMEFSPQVNELLRSLRSQGLRGLLAGGAVRDSYANMSSGGSIESKDLDFEVYPSADEAGDSVSNENIEDRLVRAASTVGSVDKVGQAFGVFKMMLSDGTDIDLSIPRSETKTGDGHTGFDVSPDVNLGVDKATLRRDFTLNSMMFDPENDVIVDPQGGAKDLSEGVLRHTSPAFAEDPLRVLRGFQFSSRFGLSMDADTVELSRGLGSEFDTISTERVQTEWEKWATKSTNPGSGLRVLADTGWDEKFSGLRDVNDENMSTRVVQAQMYAEHYDVDKRVLLPASVMVSMDPDKRRAFARETIIGKDVQRDAVNLADSAHGTSEGTAIEDISSPAEAKTAALESKARLRARLALSRALMEDGSNDNTDDTRERLRTAEKAILDAGVMDGREADLVDGNDVLAMTDEPPGRWVADVLTRLRWKQAHEDFASRDEALEYARTLLNEKEK